MAWKQIRLPRAATTAILPVLNRASLMYAEDRQRVNVHSGSRWRECAYRDDFPLGTLIMNEFRKSPSEIFPAVPRWTNQDLSLANWPLLVPELRAEKGYFDGVTDFTVSVSGSVVTVTSDAIKATAMINLLYYDAVVSNYQNSSEPANFDGTPKYDVAGAIRCINVNGTDFAVTGTNSVAKTITVSGTPTQGTTTMCVYPYRIAGSNTTARLFKIAGFAPVGAGDAGIEVVGGFRRMDRAQGMVQVVSAYSNSVWNVGLSRSLGTGNGQGGTYNTGGAVSDGTNGTPRTGKTTDPRTASLWFYTWATQYVA